MPINAAVECTSQASDMEHAAKEAGWWEEFDRVRVADIASDDSDSDN